MTLGYYSDHLSANRLKECYELAPSRVRQSLEAEIQHILDRIQPSDCVLELGCGYGRVLDRLAGKAQAVVGVDTSIASLDLAVRCGSPFSLRAYAASARSAGGAG